MTKIKIMENIGKIIGALIVIYFLIAFILWKMGQPVLFNTSLQLLIFALAGVILLWIIKSYFKGSPVTAKQIIFAVLLLAGVFYVVQYKLGVDILTQAIYGIQSFIPFP